MVEQHESLSNKMTPLSVAHPKHCRPGGWIDAGVNATKRTLVSTHSLLLLSLIGGATNTRHYGRGRSPYCLEVTRAKDGLWPVTAQGRQIMEPPSRNGSDYWLSNRYLLELNSKPQNLETMSHVSALLSSTSQTLSGCCRHAIKTSKAVSMKSLD